MEEQMCTKEVTLSVRWLCKAIKLQCIGLAAKTWVSQRKDGLTTKTHFFQTNALPLDFYCLAQKSWLVAVLYKGYTNIVCSIEETATVSGDITGL